MFHTITRWLLLIALVNLPLFAQSNSEDAEKNAIIQVLWDSELAFFSGDSLLYDSCFPHDRDGLNLGYGISFGPWHKFEPSQPIRNGQARLPLASLTELLIHRDYFILIDHDLAWATFIQELKEPKKTGVISTLRRLNRTLIKQNGAWKILNNTWVELDCQPKEVKYFNLIEQVMYFMLWDGEFQKGLGLAKFRQQWYPNSAHAIFDVGFFYDKLGDTKTADKYFKQALALIEEDEVTSNSMKEMIKNWLDNRSKATQK